MKLATISAAGRDGALVVVSRDNQRYIEVSEIAETLQIAIENWKDVEPVLQVKYEALNAGTLSESKKIVGGEFLAPLPRSWQWLDGSAFECHGELMDKVIGITPEKTEAPLMYQGVSDKFYGPTEDVVMASEDLGIDFEGEFGIIVDETPMGTSADDAFDHIQLIVQINDWSLRALAGVEMKTGFGWVRAKPPCSMAPFAITPDELGSAWKDGRVHLDLTVDWNGKRFGNANGGPMGFGFHELVAHAALTRELCAGTVIGSGTVSNENYREIGSSCIAERRGIEIVDEGAPKTEFMKYGDEVRMDVLNEDGESLFGAIQQKVVKP